MQDTIKIETWLPVFPGFYNTIFEPDTGSELYYQNQEKDDALPEMEYDDLDFDNKAYEEEVVSQCCSILEGELKDFVTAINFQSISSPREYNFSNDSGNVEIELTPENFVKIREYIYAHQKEYEKYLKRYKSYDGFMSFYGYDFEDWVEYTKDFTDYSEKEHYLGSVLEFICDMEDINQETLYYGMEVYIGEFCKDRTNQIKCTECGEWFDKDESPEYLEYKKMCDKQVKIWKETQGDKPFKLKTFEEMNEGYSLMCETCKKIFKED